MSPLILIAALVSYLAILFWIARLADRRRFSHTSWSRHPIIYTLALSVYCTSWTFYGLVGTAASQGWYYLPILLGPILLFTLGYPLLQRISTLCRQQHIHSIADFLCSRYGKRQSVAVVVTILVLLATVPYIALQLKAVTESILISVNSNTFAGQDITLVTAMCMTVFTLVFGANRLDVASYHSGIMAAIAFESIIKLIALVAIGIFAATLSFHFNSETIKTPNIIFSETTLTPSFWVLTLVSACSILCLPRMFHVTFVECLSERHLRFARTGFAIYATLIAIAIFSIAWAGNLLLSETQTNSDTYVLALPLAHGNKTLALLGFLGGFSAATAMIIVATLTLSQMLSNDVILPVLMRAKKIAGVLPDYSRALKITRRLTVIAIIGLAWIYQHSLAENVALTDIGLVAFALAVQLTPPMLLGLYWQRCNAMGVFAGLAAGTVIWFITLILPLWVEAGFSSPALLEQGLFGFQLLRPEYLLGFDFSDAYTRGVILSTAANILAIVIISHADKVRLSDRIQAGAFVNRATHDTTVQNLKVFRDDIGALLRQFLGDSTTERLLANDASTESAYASSELLVSTEQALAGVIGVASTRAMLVSLSSGDSLGVADVVNIFEETTRTLQFNQDMLFASFESISSAISVVNADLKMVAWNRRYEQMFNYPEGMLRVGRPVAELVHFNAERGMLGSGSVEQHVQSRLKHLFAGKAYRVVRNHNDGVIEIKGRPLPQGGYVTTYDDISEFIDAQNELEKVNLNLEQRVQERTEEIEKINYNLREEIAKRKKTEAELVKAKAKAEFANATKTQFLATASHDIMQPVNAAKLYTSALLEKPGLDGGLQETLKHLHDAIDSADFIISSLLEISRLDTGALKPQRSVFALNTILEPLANEFRVQANSNIELLWQPTRLWTESDPRYLRRIVQNFLSNAVKYTREGKILLGCRRHGNFVEICVYDTGPGISETNQQRIFDDFYRIDSEVEGIGLGLGIAQRFAKLLAHPLKLVSAFNHGSMFSITVPIRQAQQTLDQPMATIDLTRGLNQLLLFYVDDDQNNILALGKLVENWDCKYTSARNRQQVLEYQRQSAAPDVILMDYQLNDLCDGIELAQQLCEYWGKRPVCVVSAAPNEVMHERIKELGYDFLRKPIKPSKLRALLESYKQRQSAR